MEKSTCLRAVITFLLADYKFNSFFSSSVEMHG